jgi:hypothetical protein
MEDLFHDLSPGSPQGTKGKRTMLKCDFCRQKKLKVSIRSFCLGALEKPHSTDTDHGVKCLPYPRAWPGVKCDACVKGGQACGPNIQFRSSAGSTEPTRGFAMPVSPSSAFAISPSSTFSPHLSHLDYPYSVVDNLQNSQSVYTKSGETSATLVSNQPLPVTEFAAGTSSWSLATADQAYGRNDSVSSIKKWYVVCFELCPTESLPY